MGIKSTSSEDTERLAEKLAHNLHGGEVIELVSDLGGGKTTFVRGLVRGLGSVDRVASPTFTISKLYKSDRFDIHHFDFYRLGDAGLVGLELHDLLGEPRNIILIEWGESVAHILPEARATVLLRRTAELERAVTIKYPDSLAYLVAGIS